MVYGVNVYSVYHARQAAWTLTLVAVTTFMLVIDLTVVTVALGSIQAELNASLAALQWVVDAYALALAVLLLAGRQRGGGRAAGRRRAHGRVRLARGFPGQPAHRSV